MFNVEIDQITLISHTMIFMFFFSMFFYNDYRKLIFVVFDVFFVKSKVMNKFRFAC